MITLSSIAPESGSFGNTLTRRCDFSISSCAFTSWVKGSIFSRAFHETGRVLALGRAEPISVLPGAIVVLQGISARRSPPGTPPPYVSKVVSRPCGRRPPYLQTDSYCEHHMVPIIGKAHVAYQPRSRVVGISKLARVVDAYAKRLQIQEKM